MRNDSSVKRIIYLITDGTQNPKQLGSQVLDPVVTSQQLYDNDVAIFAIGVGSLVSADELERITRNPDRVFVVNHPNELVGKDFYLNMASKTCKEVGKIFFIFSTRCDTLSAC